MRPGLRGKAAQDVLFVVRAVNYSVHLNQIIRALPGPVHPRMVHGLTGSPFNQRGKPNPDATRKDTA